MQRWKIEEQVITKGFRNGKGPDPLIDKNRPLALGKRERGTTDQKFEPCIHTDKR